jgi:hypothetical protein
MKVAMILLCCGAVGFLLCVLAGLMKEAMHLPPGPVRVYLAKFHPSVLHRWKLVSSERGELIVMPSDAQKSKFPFRIGDRIALLALVAAGLLYPLSR